MAGGHVAYWCILHQVLRHSFCADDIEGRMLDSRQVRERVCAIQDDIKFRFHGFISGRRDLARVAFVFCFFKGGAGAFDLGGAGWGEVGFECWDSGGVWGWGAEVVAEMRWDFCGFVDVEKEVEKLTARDVI